MMCAMVTTLGTKLSLMRSKVAKKPPRWDLKKGLRLADSYRTNEFEMSICDRAANRGCEQGLHKSASPSCIHDLPKRDQNAHRFDTRLCIRAYLS